MPSERDKASENRWRPWRFSLWSIMILILAVGCFFGGWTAREQKQRQKDIEQREAIEAALAEFDT